MILFFIAALILHIYGLSFWWWIAWAFTGIAQCWFTLANDNTETSWFRAINQRLKSIEVSIRNNAPLNPR